MRIPHNEHGNNALGDSLPEFHVPSGVFQSEPPPAVLGIDMGVDLGGQDGAVPQEVLNLTDIRPVCHKLGGHRMAQHMRREMGGYPGRPCAFPEHETDGLGGQRLRVPVDEEGA